MSEPKSFSIFYTLNLVLVPSFQTKSAIDLVWISQMFVLLATLPFLMFIQRAYYLVLRLKYLKMALGFNF